MTTAPSRPTTTAEFPVVGAAALGIGGAACSTAIVPFLGTAMLVPALGGVALAVVALARRERPRVVAAAGLVLSAVGAALCLLATILLPPLLHGVRLELDAAVERQRLRAGPERSVAIAVTGTAHDVEIVTGRPDGELRYGVFHPPFHAETRAPQGALPGYAVVARSTDGPKPVTVACSIVVDGVVVARQEMNGDAAEVRCAVPGRWMRGVGWVSR